MTSLDKRVRIWYIQLTNDNFREMSGLLAISKKKVFWPKIMMKLDVDWPSVKNSQISSTDKENIIRNCEQQIISLGIIVKQTDKFLESLHLPNLQQLKVKCVSTLPSQIETKFIDANIPVLDTIQFTGRSR